MSPLRLRLTHACVVIGVLVAGLMPALACAAPAVPATSTPAPAPPPIVRTATFGPHAHADHLGGRSRRQPQVSCDSQAYARHNPADSALHVGTAGEAVGSADAHPPHAAERQQACLRRARSARLDPFGDPVRLQRFGRRAPARSRARTGSHAQQGARRRPDVRPRGWVDFSGGAASDAPLFLSKAYRYDVRTKTYPGGGASTVRELISETASMSVDQGGGSPATVALELAASGRHTPSATSSCRARPSRTRCARQARSPSSRVRSGAGSIRSAPTTRLPTRSSPTTRRGYVRSLLDMRGGKTLAAYRATKSRLFGDLLANDLYTLGRLSVARRVVADGLHQHLG